MSLHFEAVSPELLELLQQLMRDEAISDFYLVGGTALALRFGHRESVDIDLFTHNAFDAPTLASRLKDRYGMTETETATNTVRGVIGGIKVDVIAHRYPQIAPVEIVDGIRMCSIEDAAAMKLNAIANRGSKKDFWDCAELLRLFTRDELLNFCLRKYADDSLWNVEKSLCYFEDAENEPDPRDLRGQCWEQVKKIITDHNRL
jgi:hypothetical protein